VPGIDAPLEEHDHDSSPGIPISTLNVHRGRGAPRTRAPPRRNSAVHRPVPHSTAPALVIPPPTTEAAAVYSRIQDQLDGLRSSIEVLSHSVDPESLVTFGETKEDVMPSITDIGSFIAKTNVEANNFITKCASLTRQVEQLMAKHTKVASNCYTRRVMEVTVREAQRVRNEVAQINDRMRRDQEERDRLLASLPSNPRPTRRQRH